MTLKLKIFFTILISSILVACGGGDSSSPTRISSTSVDAESAYTGVKNKAILTRSNSLEFVTALLGRNSGDELIPQDTFSDSNTGTTNTSTDPETPQAIANRPTLNTFRSQIVLADLSNRILTIDNNKNTIYQARSINESETCYQGGSLSVSGELNDSNIGYITFQINNCVEDGITINGTIGMNITKYDSNNDTPTAYTISFNDLSMVYQGDTYSAIGTQSFTRDESYIETTITNMLQVDNNGNEILAKDLTARYEDLYTEFSGKIYLSEHGYVDVTTPEPTRINNNILTYVGEIILSGAASSKIRISVDYNRETFEHRQQIDLDEDGNGIFDYISLNNGNINWDNLESFTINTPPEIFTEVELTSSYNNSLGTRNLDEIWINDNLLLKAYAYDPQGKKVSYQWTLESSPPDNTFEIPDYGFYVLDSSDSQSATAAGFTSGRGMPFMPNVSGNYEFSIKSTDGDGFTSIQFINLTVQENQPPTAIINDEDGINFLSDDLGYTSEELINLDGRNSSDLENDITSYLWTIGSKPAGSNLDISEKNKYNTLTAAADVSGTYVFILKVTDEQGASGTDSISIYIPENQAPTTSNIIPSVTNRYSISFNNYLSFTTEVNDREGGNLSSTWVLTSKPSGSNATFGESYGRFLVNPDLEGTYTINYTVTDSHGAFDTTSYSFEITGFLN